MSANLRNLFLLIFVGSVIYLSLIDRYQLPSISIPAVPVLRKVKSTLNLTLDRTTSLQESPSIPSFYPGLDAFPWENFTQAVRLRQMDAIAVYSSRLLLWLTPYLGLEPKTPINASCTPPPLELSNCKNKNGTSSQLRSKPRKVAILIQFGFDVDILEIYLNEVYDVVDKFFILESSHSYTYVFKKRLVWEGVRKQPRFSKFADKIVHFLLDDAEAAVMKSLRKRNPYGAENHQESSRWEKFLKWNNVIKLFEDDDLLGFGDSDEIPARHVIQYLKYCDLPSDPVDIGSWFVLGKVSQALKTDWPVKGHNFTLGDPTFWSLRTAKNRNVRFLGFQIPTRNRGNSSSFLIGGTHISDYPYLPHCLAKRLTNTEQNLEFIEAVASYPNFRKNMSLPELEDFYASVAYNRFWPDRKFNLRDVPQKDLEDMYLPWFYECNRQRYPALEGKHDPRLD